MTQQIEVMQVATEIYNQLGGGKFRVMTGATNLMSDKNALSFRLPSTANYVRDGINYVRVTLNALDLYDLEFKRIRGLNVTDRGTRQNVPAEALRAVFTEVTGLEVSLGTMGR